MIATGEVVGVLCINYRTRHAFLEDEQQMLEIAAQFAAEALHNAETNELTEELIATRERMQLASQLHHSISQYLPAIRIMVETALTYVDGRSKRLIKWLESIDTAATRAMKEVRVNLFELNTRGFNGYELRDALKEQARDARTYFGLQVDLRLDLEGGLRMPIARELLMVCREAIANTGKHADAKQLILELQIEPHRVWLSVQDDGRGFDTHKIPGQDRRGLAMMEHRIDNLNGRLDISSQPGNGTVIQVEIPIIEEGQNVPTVQ